MQKKKKILKMRVSLFQDARVSRSLPQCSYEKYITKHERNDFMFSLVFFFSLERNQRVN